MSNRNLSFFLFLFFTLTATMSYSYNGIKKKGKEILPVGSSLLELNSNAKKDIQSSDSTKQTYNIHTNNNAIVNDVNILNNSNDLRKINDVHPMSYKRKGNNMRKNINKLYKTLISEDSRREQETAVNEMNEFNRIKENEKTHLNQKEKQQIEENEEGNVKTLKNTENQEKPMNESVENDVISLVKNISEKTSSNDDTNIVTDNSTSILNNSKAKIEKEKIEINTKNRNILDVYGQNEKMKSESSFNLLNFFKNLFQKYTYLNFKEYVDVFFKKYDQRVLESISYFNFDEILF